MKELSIEEKAKLYDETIERAKKVLLDCTPEEQKVVEYISPEIAESKDNMKKYRTDYKSLYEETISRLKIAKKNFGSDTFSSVIDKVVPGVAENNDVDIRKWIIENIQETLDVDGFFEGQKTMAKDAIAWLKKQGEQKPNPYSGVGFVCNGHTWGMCARDNGVDILLDKQLFKHLEKQGEQKSADKVEPKFKVDSFIVNNSRGVCQVTEIRDDEYCLYPLYGEIMGYLKIIDVDNEYHLWTIQDAKDGDVLATRLSPEGDWIGIYKDSLDILGFKTYCYLNGVGEFVINPNRSRNHGTHGLHPATKEQRDLLFSKMKESGYEWDAKDKVLRKIEQKTTWGEEDEEMFDAIIADIQFTQKAHNHEVNQVVYEREIDWFKSLKERVQLV